jgi:glycolate oxidase iron-sulfur subunit
MLLLEGCVQPSMSPNINIATSRVLDALGVQLFTANGAGCCGAIRLHLAETEAGLEDARRNIDAWWPHIESGVDAIVMNASGCGATVKEYGHLLRDDPKYSAKAERVSALTKDLAEILPEFSERLVAIASGKHMGPIAFHPPCTLQHGQKIKGAVESLLRSIGVDVFLPADAHLCCGSAGTYSISQPELAGQLRKNKLNALEAGNPEVIVSANIGCITHLGAKSQVPVRHWVEFLDDLISGKAEA